MPHLKVSKVSKGISADIQNIARLFLWQLHNARNFLISSSESSVPFTPVLPTMPERLNENDNQSEKKITCDISFPLVAHLAGRTPGISLQLALMKSCPCIYFTNCIKITYLASFLFFLPQLGVHFRPPTGYPCKFNYLQGMFKSHKIRNIARHVWK